jgi:hypothetical protein
MKTIFTMITISLFINTAYATCASYEEILKKAETARTYMDAAPSGSPFLDSNDLNKIWDKIMNGKDLSKLEKGSLSLLDSQLTLRDLIITLELCTQTK